MSGEGQRRKENSTSETAYCRTIEMTEANAGRESDDKVQRLVTSTFSASSHRRLSRSLIASSTLLSTEAYSSSSTSGECSAEKVKPYCLKNQPFHDTEICGDEDKVEPIALLPMHRPPCQSTEQAGEDNAISRLDIALVVKAYEGISREGSGQRARCVLRPQ